MKIIFSPKCLEYGQPGHPESPDRVKRTHDFLKEKGYEFTNAETCSEEDLLSVHDKEYIERVKERNFFSPDTPNLLGIFDYARLSVGSAIKSMKIALKNEKAFSLMRPPGHHAGKRNIGGFCYFNNIAIAVQKALNSVEKIAIIDFDCHHGQGTQQIFFGNDKVLFVSLHKYEPFFYPETGGRPEKNCLNYPLPCETAEKTYLQTLNRSLSEVKKFGPDLIAISAGFDTHKDDPLTGGLGLKTKSFREIGKRILDLGKPSFAVLEGGYGEKMPECIHEFLVGYSR